MEDDLMVTDRKVCYTHSRDKAFGFKVDILF